MKKKWTKEELEYLENNWGNVRMKTLESKLNRTNEAIKIKATRLGLGGAKTNGSLYITASQAAKILGVDRKTVLRKIKNGEIQAKYQNIAPYQKWYCIKFEHFLEWLKENQDKYDATRVEEYALGYEYSWLKRKRSKDLKLNIKNANKKYTDEDVEKIKHMLNMHVPIKEIAKIFKRSEAAIRRKIKREEK